MSGTWSPVYKSIEPFANGLPERVSEEVRLLASIAISLRRIADVATDDFSECADVLTEVLNHCAFTLQEQTKGDPKEARKDEP